MAAKVATQENTLQSINDVSSLYDEYYATVQHDFKELGGQSLLKVAGIVSFFRVVDRTNDLMIQEIQKAFDFAADEFWESASQLHAMEILDKYEDEVIRISDQVLATYLFYLAVFKEQVLDFSTLLVHFFPRLRQRLIDAVYPVLNAFDNRAVEMIMRPHVDNLWKSLEAASDDEGLLQLAEVFFFLKSTDVLIYIRNIIERMEPEWVDLSTVKFKADSSPRLIPVFDVLSLFRYLDESSLRLALELLFDHLAKRPSETPQVLYILTERLGFTHTSYLNAYLIQIAIIEILWRRVHDETLLFSRLFLVIAEKYLHTRFFATEAKGKNTVTIIHFDISPSPELFSLRQTIWQGLFQLYQMPNCQSIVLSVLNAYSRSGYLSS